MHIAFKKNSGGFFDRLIALRTGSQFVHVEIVFSDDVTWKVQQADHPAVHYERHVDYPPERWTLIEFEPYDENKIRRWCTRQVGKSYDWVGILNFIVPFGEDDDKDLFCSEGVVLALQQDGWLAGVKAKMTSPAQLYKLFENKWS